MAGGTVLAALLGTFRRHARHLVSRSSRLLDTRVDLKDGLTGTCRLCGKRRHDLGDDELCRPCSMGVW